jgi:hypothetical protein
MDATVRNCLARSAVSGDVLTSMAGAMEGGMEAASFARPIPQLSIYEWPKTVLPPGTVSLRVPSLCGA